VESGPVPASAEEEAAAKAAAIAKQQEEVEAAAAIAKQQKEAEASARAVELAKKAIEAMASPPPKPAAQAANKLLARLNEKRAQKNPVEGSAASFAPRAAQWSVENTVVLVPGYEKTVEGKIQWLSESQHTSVAATVENLNTRKVVSIRGYCIMLSRSLGKYVLLHRVDKKAEALKALKLSEGSQATYAPPA